MSTLLPYYAITRVCSLESYHVITLLRYYMILCECFLYVVSLLRCYARFLADVSSILYTLLQVYVLFLLYCLLTLLWIVIFLPISFPVFTCSNLLWYFVTRLFRRTSLWQRLSATSATQRSNAIGHS